MILAEARPEIESSSYPLPREKSECLPQPPKTPDIPLVVIRGPHGKIKDVGAVVGLKKRRFRKNLLEIEVIEEEGKVKVVEEKQGSARLQFIGHRDSPKPPPPPPKRGATIDY